MAAKSKPTRLNIRKDLRVHMNAAAAIWPLFKTLPRDRGSFSIIAVGRQPPLGVIPLYPGLKLGNLMHGNKFSAHTIVEFLSTRR